MIELNSLVGIITFLTGLLSIVGVAVAAVVISLHRKKQESVENE